MIFTKPLCEAIQPGSFILEFNIESEETFNYHYYYANRLLDLCYNFIHYENTQVIRTKPPATLETMCLREAIAWREKKSKQKSHICLPEDSVPINGTDAKYLLACWTAVVDFQKKKINKEHVLVFDAPEFRTICTFWSQQMRLVYTLRKDSPFPETYVDFKISPYRPPSRLMRRRLLRADEQALRMYVVLNTWEEDTADATDAIEAIEAEGTSQTSA